MEVDVLGVVELDRGAVCVDVEVDGETESVDVEEIDGEPESVDALEAFDKELAELPVILVLEVRVEEDGEMAAAMEDVVFPTAECVILNCLLAFPEVPIKTTT